MELRERLRLTLPTDQRARSYAVARSERRSSENAALPSELRSVGSKFGKVCVAENSWPLDYEHGRFRLGQALGLNDRALARLAPGCDRADLADAAFVDVETTGLAGGTGTYAFLIGIGIFGGSSFRLRQFFLADLPGEAAMLDAASRIISNSSAIVSFNGRRFDLPLLETRFALNRMATGPMTNDVDLLYPARRLFRHRLPNCRLASLEEGPLGVERGHDLPGSAIPSIYFQYLRRGWGESLSMVLRHNALDILSLVTLLGCLGRLAGEETPTDPEVCFALARWDESHGRLRSATELFELALKNGPALSTRSAISRHLIRLYRRQGRWDDMAELADRQVRGGGAPEDRLHTLIELAKIEEHRRHDYAAAEDLTRQALALTEVMTAVSDVSTAALMREALEYRRSRLRRRQRGVKRYPGRRQHLRGDVL